MNAWIIVAALWTNGHMLTYQPTVMFDKLGCFREAASINHRWLEEHREGVAVCRRMDNPP